MHTPMSYTGFTAVHGMGDDLNLAAVISLKLSVIGAACVLFVSVVEYIPSKCSDSSADSV